jgi:hypothetical protein
LIEELLGTVPFGEVKRWEDKINIDFWEPHCEDQKWMGLDQECIQWKALVSAILNLHILLIKVFVSLQSESSGKLLLSW